MLERLNVDKFKHNIPDRSFYSLFEISQALNISIDGILDYLASGELKAKVNIAYKKGEVVSIGGKPNIQEIYLEKDKSFISFNGGLGLNISLKKKLLSFEVKGKLPRISYIRSEYVVSKGKTNKKNCSLENRDVSFNAYFDIDKNFFSENHFSLSQNLKEAYLRGKCKLIMREDGFFSNLTLFFKKPYAIELGQIKISHTDLIYFLTKEQKPIDRYKAEISYITSIIDSHIEEIRNISYNKFFKRKDLNKPYKQAKAQINKLQNIIDNAKDSPAQDNKFLDYKATPINASALEYQNSNATEIKTDNYNPKEKETHLKLIYALTMARTNKDFSASVYFNSKGILKTSTMMNDLIRDFEESGIQGFSADSLRKKLSEILKMEELQAMMGKDH